MDQDRRGVLYPQRLPEFHRLEPAPELAHAVRWFWIPEWDLPDGAELRQELLPFPSCNLVVEPHGAHLFGPVTRVSERVLRGRGWAVSALLRPAAAIALVDEPARLRDGFEAVDAAALGGSDGRGSGGRSGDLRSDLHSPDIHRAVAELMENPRALPRARRNGAASLLGSWLGERVPPPAAGSEAELANELERLLADPAIVRVDQLPQRLHVSLRTVQRLAAHCFGISARAMIRRRRLQEGAERLREDPALPIAVLAGELGYADHAHFANDFRALLGVAPSEYRRRAAAG